MIITKIKVSRATVYRTIDVLVKNRLVRKMDVGDGKSLFEPRLDDTHHDHMICIKTGKIIAFYDEEIELGIKKSLQAGRIQPATSSSV